VKLCITARGQTLDAAIDQSFGRAPYFLFVDSETEAIETVENKPGAHGAGVQAAELVAGKKASVVITGNMGPNAYRGLSAAGIEVYTGAQGKVRDAFEDYRAGRLTCAEGPTGGRHGGGRR
jgi:predicted Fe-Mo cluster-binding NifX family protein